MCFAFLELLLEITLSLGVLRNNNYAAGIAVEAVNNLAEVFYGWLSTKITFLDRKHAYRLVEYYYVVVFVDNFWSLCLFCFWCIEDNLRVVFYESVRLVYDFAIYGHVAGLDKLLNYGATIEWILV